MVCVFVGDFVVIVVVGRLCYVDFVGYVVEDVEVVGGEGVVYECLWFGFVWVDLFELFGGVF